MESTDSITLMNAGHSWTAMDANELISDSSSETDSDTSSNSQTSSSGDDSEVNPTSGSRAVFCHPDEIVCIGGLFLVLVIFAIVFFGKLLHG